jgi:CO/xanthine dehydrogenase FAD-binding subunit
MRPAPFAYAAARSVDDAVKLLTQYGGDAKLIAGGQSLMPLLNFRVATPSYLIDISGLTDLDYIRSLSDGIVIGALTRQRTIELSELVQKRCPLLHEAIRHVGHVQTRNRGTIGGSLAHGDAAAELPAVVVALGGRLVLQSGAGRRTLSAGEFFQTYLTTALKPDEILVAIELDGWSTNAGYSFQELGRRKGDFALVGAAAGIVLTPSGQVARAGLALMGVGPTPVDLNAALTDLFRGRAPSDADLAAIADMVSANIEPESDIHAPADYRRHLAGVLAKRAVSTAIARARASRGPRCRKNARSSSP